MIEGLEVNYQNHDDEEAEFERDELERQNEVKSYYKMYRKCDEIM